jgi:hypothetical protein
MEIPRPGCHACLRMEWDVNTAIQKTTRSGFFCPARIDSLNRPLSDWLPSPAPSVSSHHRQLWPCTVLQDWRASPRQDHRRISWPQLLSEIAQPGAFTAASPGANLQGVRRSQAAGRAWAGDRGFFRTMQLLQPGSSRTASAP